MNSSTSVWPRWARSVTRTASGWSASARAIRACTRPRPRVDRAVLGRHADDVVVGPGDAAEGQRLYVTLGCRGCHIQGDAGGYVGPPLTDAGKRLKPGWTYTWLKGPQRWRADVRCPNYGLSDTDALRLTAYLETLRTEKGQAQAGGRK